MLVHKLNDMGTGCTCKEPFCKKWKDTFPKPGQEKRCPRCWTLASLYETEVGQIIDWCISCEQPIPNAAVV